MHLKWIKIKYNMQIIFTILSEKSNNTENKYLMVWPKQMMMRVNQFGKNYDGEHQLNVLSQISTVLINNNKNITYTAV